LDFDFVAPSRVWILQEKVKAARTSLRALFILDNEITKAKQLGVVDQAGLNPTFVEPR
jgi:hypothetical protein